MRDDQIAVERNPHRRAVLQPLKAAGQLRVVGQHRRGPDQDRIVRGAQ